MAVTVNTLYGTDFAGWAEQTSELLRQPRFDEIDIENVAEEIRSLGYSELGGATNQLRRMSTHLIERQIQPARYGSSWRTSIRNAQREIADAIQVSPSLRRKRMEQLHEVYTQTVADARYETGQAGAQAPEECPWGLPRLLESDSEALHF